MNRKSLSRRHARLVLALPILSASILTLLPCSSLGATETWNAFDGTNLWSVGSSWLDGSAPALFDPTLSLVFGAMGAQTYVADNDLAGIQLNAITFNSSSTGIVNLVGGALDMQASGLDEPILTQAGTGDVVVANELILSSGLTLGGTGTGFVSLDGVISGFGDMLFQSGNWRVGNVANNYFGGFRVGGTAFVELLPSEAAPQGVNLTPGAVGILGGNSLAGALVIDGGTLKVTTKGTGSIIAGGRTITFTENGGVLDLRNNNTPGVHGGGIAGAGGGQFVLSLTNGATNAAVIRFNGGENGLTSGATNNSDWLMAANLLRFGTIINTGAGTAQPIIVELSNGALVRGGNGAAGTVTVPNAVTIRGVPVADGGDPTSGPDGTLFSPTTRNTGRYGLDTVDVINHTAGLRFEGAMQVHNPLKVRAFDGDMTVAGTAGGNPGYVAFLGRSTGQGMTSTIHTPTTAANVNGQHVMYVGFGGNDTLTIETGGIAVFDARIRADQANHHGIYLDARAVIQPGATFRVAQSISNFSQLPGISNFNTGAVVGDIVLNGPIVGQGTTANEAVFDIYLPAPNAGGTVTNGTPAPLPAAVLTPSLTARPYGGLVANASHNIIVNGSGFGGLRINALARPDALFSETQTLGGAPVPDPASNALKLSSYLSASRLSNVTGTGGYLTPAAAGEAFTFPAGGEWAANVPVGLRVANSNPGGIDLIMGPSTWGHNLAVDSGADLSLGSGNPFVFTAGTLQGAGTVTGSGGMVVNSGAAIAPGFNGLGTLNISANLVLNGGLMIDLAGTSSDLLALTGDLVLGGALSLSGTYGTGDLTIATYSGTLTNTFSAVSGLSPDFVIDFGTGTNSSIRLIFSPANEIVWEGLPGANWNAADLNWKNSAVFANGSKVIFDDTATGSKNVTINAGDVQPSLVTVNTAATYTLAGSAGNAMVGTARLVKGGSGVLVLSGPHSYSGGTAVDAGTLRIGADHSLPDIGTITIATGAVLDTDGRTDSVGALAVEGTISGGGSISSPAVSFGNGASGALAALTTSTLSLGSGVSLTVNALLLNGPLTRTAGGAGSTISGAMSLGSQIRVFSIGAGATPELTIAAIISDGGITKTGAGVLVLAATNTYAGGTTVNEGILRAAAAGALPATGNLVVGPGATVDGGDQPLSIGSLAGSGSVSLGSGSLTMNAGSSSVFGGVIDGAAAAVVKAGAAVLTLTGTNTFGGGLTVSGGRVNLAAPGSGGGGEIRVNTGGTLQIGATIPNSLVLDGGIVSSQTAASVGTGEWSVIGNSTIDTFNKDSLAATEVIFTGLLSGNASLTLNAAPAQNNADSGTGFRLRGTGLSTYSGTITANSSTKFEIQMNDSFSPNPAGNAKIVMIGGSSQGELLGSYSQLQPRLVSAFSSYLLGNDVELSGPGYVNINVLGASDVIAQFGNLRIGDGQILAANKNDSAVRTVEFETVTLAGGTAEFRVFDPNFGVSGNAARGGSNLSLGNLTEAVPGSGIVLRANGSFYIEFAGTTSHTGPTVIQSGSVRITGSMSGTTGVQVLGGTLEGSGTVFAPVTVGDGLGAASSAAIAPGIDGAFDPIGTLSTGPVSFDNADAEFRVQIDSTVLTSDLLSVTGSLSLGAGVAVLNVTDRGFNLLDDGETFVIASASTGVSGFFAGFAEGSELNAGSSLFRVSYLNNQVSLVAIPEPASLASLIAGLGVCLGLRRRGRSP